MIRHLGEAIAAISDGDFFALALLAAVVAFTCGFLVTRGS